MDSVKLIECPRDAWQGLEQFIPTEEKVAYLRKLIEAGFRHIDAVSFVSPKHVKQMADSEEVMRLLLTSLPPTSLPPEIIGIVVNEKGMERALACTGVTTLGYPYSISAYFRRANANMSRAESRALVETLRTETERARRDLVIYISMAFGNPYDEPWGPEIVIDTLEWLRGIGVRTVSLADTVGTATAEAVGQLFRDVQSATRGMELGVHLHSRPDGAAEKVLAAYDAGCRRFDSALTGLGGCPFAGDHLVGNIATEIVVPTLAAKGADTGINPDALAEVIAPSREIAAKYGSAPVVH
ncbi:MAG: hydroxymethylglutaryl-CoA lyase [Candidatus Acidiferrales bacterium]